MEFLRRQADELGLDFKIEAPVTPKKPIVIMTWVGTQPELESIVLNSHMDVVPVFEVEFCLKYSFRTLRTLKLSGVLDPQAIFRSLG